jgi:hypothetical protein
MHVPIKVGAFPSNLHSQRGVSGQDPACSGLGVAPLAFGRPIGPFVGRGGGFETFRWKLL